MLTRSLRARFEFEPRDLWVGVYWDRSPTHWHVYLTAVPCLPLHVSWRRPPPRIVGT